MLLELPTVFPLFYLGPWVWCACLCSWRSDFYKLSVRTNSWFVYSGEHPLFTTIIMFGWPENGSWVSLVVHLEQLDVEHNLCFEFYNSCSELQMMQPALLLSILAWMSLSSIDIRCAVSHLACENQWPNFLGILTNERNEFNQDFHTVLRLSDKNIHGIFSSLVVYSCN